jgi:hypothetical protein
LHAAKSTYFMSNQNPATTEKSQLPLISVIMNFYEGEEYLANTIESVIGPDVSELDNQLEGPPESALGSTLYDWIHGADSTSPHKPPTSLSYCLFCLFLVPSSAHEPPFGSFELLSLKTIQTYVKSCSYFN